MRHGLAHVLDGHLRDLAPAADSGDWETYEETVADIFALVDLTPDYRLDMMIEHGAGAADLEAWVREESALCVPGWPAERLGGRARHRVWHYLRRARGDDSGR